MNKNEKGLLRQFKPKSRNQAEYIRAIVENELIFCVGPAGSGKTACAVGIGTEYLYNGKCSKLIITRPTVGVGDKLDRDIGYLPGGIRDKMEPYLIPIFDELATYFSKPGLESMIRDGIIEIAPLNYMRGRSQPISEQVLTPNGYIEIGKLSVGDAIINSSGIISRVQAVYPQGKLDVYKVEFNDGTHVLCSKDHLWTTSNLYENAKGMSSVKTTEDIINSIKNNHGQKEHRIKLISDCVYFENKQCIVHPYLVGVLLGDGHLGNNQIGFTTKDTEIIDTISSLLPPNMIIKHRNNYDYRIVSTNNNNTLKKHLKDIGIYGKTSVDKYIPIDYKINSKEVRISVLRGLMDTDGWVCHHRSGNSRAQFCSISRCLAEDVMFIVRSLGGYAYMRERKYSEKDTHLLKGREIKHNHPSYIVDIRMKDNPFSLERKASIFENNLPKHKIIISVSPYGFEECVCIKTSADDALYVTSGFNLTHNTFHDSFVIIDEGQNLTHEHIKMLTTRIGSRSKMVINGDIKQHDRGTKTCPLETWIYEIVHDDEKIAVCHMDKTDIVRSEIVTRVLNRVEEWEKDNGR